MSRPAEQTMAKRKLAQTILVRLEGENGAGLVFLLLLTMN